MQLTNLLGLCVVALAGSATAMPHLAAPYHGDHIPVRVPTNSTGAHNATTTGTRGKAPLTTGLSKAKNGTDGRNPHATHIPEVKHIPNHVKHIDHCNELCSLESQTCTIAMPEDDKYCWQMYLSCKAKCVPSDFE
ncbi:hypothetical protein PENDEC_c001G05565 [Penicillium decumbens]|uniref:Uncharacterized protein n=1 Tax=Penicillium decumbens TaxID=69771 RepID=A0A1V6PNA9_PENDC|nr:hypothetical protein PENDEC_c001G05565 [Penicillium decumbens]